MAGGVAGVGKNSQEIHQNLKTERKRKMPRVLGMAFFTTWCYSNDVFLSVGLKEGIAYFQSMSNFCILFLFYR